MIDDRKSFIEVQFPVSKISKESYKERKANLGQTLTGLGKWWGRKPLILVRATLLGLLLPAGQNPQKDREIFLKILTMDEEGLWQRKDKSIPVKDLYQNLTPGERKRYFTEENAKIAYKKGVAGEEKEHLQRLVFSRLSYDQKIKYCLRPEEAAHLPDGEWQKINQYLGTKASNLQELVQELGKRRFGEIPTVGDCFCGGGSVPFEGARMGCDVYASDLNPIAMLLTWAALYINGSSDDQIEKLREFQEKIFTLADQQITKWGIEHNEKCHRANAYLYCNEVICPECGFRVPLAPSWVIGKGTKTVALLKENHNRGFEIEIKSDAEKEEIKQAQEIVTIHNNNLVCPHCRMSTPITVIRKDRRNDDGTTAYGLRRWSSHEFVPRPEDVFQERLYCIRYEREYLDERGNIKTERYYTAPTKEDLEREEQVLKLLGERFLEWQNKGYLPGSMIEEGYNTDQMIRERGWGYWHQLFNPRQLLVHGLLMELIEQNAQRKNEKAIGLLGLNKCLDWNSKLCIWNVGVGTEKSQNTFSNQALNTLFNYGCRGIRYLKQNWFFKINNYKVGSHIKLKSLDARQIHDQVHFWITDPPYADAVNYHELSEFFLAWDKKMLLDIFPQWYTDSKRALAVRGTGESFNQSMVEIYQNLAEHMPENGRQVVMFTHQDVAVWADLTLILWKAGLRVAAAWNIATETESGGLKKGNYVKGTVLLVLQKQSSDETAYLDELYPEIEMEVKRQIDSMRELDDKEDPNFDDADYLLAAYAASLKVLTSYKKIEDIDVNYQLSKSKAPGTESPIERIINEAIKIAYDYLTPGGFDHHTWRMLTPEERFYIKGIELEKDGACQIGAYQELARGFGVKEYQDFLAAIHADGTRLKTVLELGMKGLTGGNIFPHSLLQHVLSSLYQAITEEDTLKGRNRLKKDLSDYWNQRNAIIEILDYLSTLEHIETMIHWREEAKYAKLLRELIKNDGI